MGDIEIISDSNDSMEFASKIKVEEIVISDDDVEGNNTKLEKKHVPVINLVSVMAEKPSRLKCLPVKKNAKKRKSSEADGNSKTSKRKCHLSEGECSKSRNKKETKSKEKKMTKTDVLDIEIIDDHVDAKPLRVPEDNKESIMKKKLKSTPNNEMHMMWSEAELVADLQNINISEAENVIHLLNAENTIPFIARYRKELTGNMEPEKLRQVKNCYEHVKNIKHKANSAICTITKLGKLTPELEKNLRCSRTINEIEHIYAPFKTTKNRPLAERARLLGLGEAAEAVLHGTNIITPSSLIIPEVKGLEKIQDVITGIQNIIVDIISKDKELLDYLRTLRKELFLLMECSKARSLKDTNTKGVKTMTAKQANQMKKKALADSENKFTNYYNFSCNINYLKPHQVLAINRGEKLKILSVKILMPDYALQRVLDFCLNLWTRKGTMYPFRDVVLKQSIKEAYNRFLTPLLTRQVRSELLQNAEQAAIEVFASNLKNLLMAAPVRGKKILAIDPGFKNGCKVALISSTGDVLETCVIYPVNTHHAKSNKTSQSSEKLKNLLFKHQCQEIALGNGTACREVEEYLSNLIKSNWFQPLDVTYTIVSEQGASIYSCSTEAKKEFPNMDPNLISAVSLARRLQDPLVELVKIEPKHLGVGMYQHDLPEKQLNATLDEVVTECASFVGVDINTASECILRRVAGLTSARAANIIEHRTKHGLFQNRNQLKEVKSIGNKTFEQCAGFVRINPETFGGRKLDFNPLDQTYIHPESYAIAHKVIKKCGLSIEHLGQTEFRKQVTEVVGKIGTKALAAEIEVPETQIQLIYEALQQPLNYDERSKYETPLFRREFKSFDSLMVNSILTGCVQNVTNFGVFVDIGVGRSGLIHSSSLQGMEPHNGQRVEVLVKHVDTERKRISLQLIKIL